MATLRPIQVDKSSPFIGEACALCKQPFAPGDELAICPEDATRHHVHCWRAYGNKCTAYGCTGRGEVLGLEEESSQFGQHSAHSGSRVYAGEESKVRTLPSRSFSCAQGCLLITAVIALIVIAGSCFGLWAIADYVATEIFNWDYRSAIFGASFIPISFLATDWCFLLIRP